MKYDVLCADTVDALICTVNDKLKKGWKLQGGIANLISTKGYMFFIKPFIKLINIH